METMARESGLAIVISKLLNEAPLESQAQGTSLFTSAASNQRGYSKDIPWDAQVRLPEGEEEAD